MLRRLFLGLLAALLAASCSFVRPGPPEDRGFDTWAHYRGDRAVTGYSSLDQIDRSNVSRLETAWVYESGDERLSTIECNPIVVDRIMYLTTPMLRVVGLDAGSGREIWSFDPFEHTGEQPRGVNRGVVYWDDGEDGRIYSSAGPYLFALDARTGEIEAGFGSDGLVDLREDLGRPAAGLKVEATSPGVVFEDMLIMGSSVGEGPGPSAPGHVRAYDLRTGERRWIFHTIPHPGESGYETWPSDAWMRVGGANSWAGLSLDVRRGLVFSPTGSAAYDHFGGDRHGDNLFANSVIALEARTGERVWHFQTVHHDVWDYDVATPPNLVTIRREGRTIDAVAQPTKTGQLFVLDRETGAALFPVEERPVPPSRLEGEALSPTQPFSSIVYAQQGFTEANRNTMTPAAAEFSQKLLDEYGTAGLFPAPSRKGDVILPQFNGGTDWGGASFDPATGMLYVNASNEAEFLQMFAAPEAEDHDHSYIDGGHQPLRGPDGYPVNERPWGTLSAIDLDDGRIIWQNPLGTYVELEEQGYAPTGTFNMGGSVVTAGGLVFIAAAMDERIRAFDKATGELLWQADLPAGGYATPATYSVDGTQFVVIAVGGGGKPGTTSGDSYVAFALPESERN